MLPTILADAALPVPAQHLVWLHSTLTTQHLADIGMSVDLSHLVEISGSSLQWSDIFQLFRLQLASYRGGTHAMPLDGSTMYMFARRGVFQQLGTQVPVTWQGILNFTASYGSLAAAAGGSGTSDSLPPYPICLPRGATCRRLSLLQAVWSSIAQTHGSQQGVHFDPVTGEPLLDTPAAREAFTAMARLMAAAAPPETDETCSHGSLAFARGRCALVFAGYVPQLRMLVLPEFNATVDMGGLEVYPLPGSDVVWAREVDSKGLQACTKELCPYASTLTSGNVTVLVNHSPLSPGSNLAGTVNRLQPIIMQYIGYAILEFLASPDRYDLHEAPPLLQTVAPVREKLVASDTVEQWVAAGYDRQLMQRAMPSIRFTREHPNRAWDLRMPYHMHYNDVLSDILKGLQNGSVVVDGDADRGGLEVTSADVTVPAVTSASNGVTVSAVASTAGRRASRRSLTQSPAEPALVPEPEPKLPGPVPVEPWQPPPEPLSSPQEVEPARRRLSQALREGQMSLANYYDPRIFLPKYLDSLAILQVADSGASSTAGSAGSRRTISAGVAAVVAASGVALGGGVAGVIFLRLHRRRRGRYKSSKWEWHRHLLDAKRRGVPSDPVALVVTDIQDSTVLWEACPAAVMSKAIQLHHAVIRRLLLLFGGYESLTEGDSFILAFRSVKQAAAFALELQAQLLLLPWPEELLLQPACSVVSAELPEGFPFNTSRQTQRDKSGRGVISGAQSRRSLRSINGAASGGPDGSLRLHQALSAGVGAVRTSGGGSGSSCRASPGGSMSAHGTAWWSHSLTHRGCLLAPTPSQPSFSRFATPRPSFQDMASAAGARLTSAAPEPSQPVDISCVTSRSVHGFASPAMQIDPARAGRVRSVAGVRGGGGSSIDGFYSSTCGEGSPGGADEGSSDGAPAAAVQMVGSVGTRVRFMGLPPTLESPVTAAHPPKPGLGGGSAQVADESSEQIRVPPLGDEAPSAAARPRPLRWRAISASALASGRAGSLEEAEAAASRHGTTTNMAPAPNTDTDIEEAARPSPFAKPEGQPPCDSADADDALPASSPPLQLQRPAPSARSSPAAALGSRFRVAARLGGSVAGPSDDLRTAALRASLSFRAKVSMDEDPSYHLQPIQRRQELLMSTAPLPDAYTDTAHDTASGGNGHTESPCRLQGGEDEGADEGARECEDRAKPAGPPPWRRILRSIFAPAARRGDGGEGGSYRGALGDGGGGGDSSSPATPRLSMCGSSGVRGPCASAGQLELPGRVSGTQRALQPPSAGERQTLSELLDDAAAAVAATTLQSQQQAQAGGTSSRPMLGGCSGRVPALVFRGLRVRVGISWAAPSAAELQHNAAAARMVYGGRCVAAAKAVADMAAGGQVVMSGAAVLQLEAECGAGPGGRPSGTMILHLGTYAVPRAPSAGQRGGGALPGGSGGGVGASSGCVPSASLGLGISGSGVMTGTGTLSTIGPGTAIGAGTGAVSATLPLLTPTLAADAVVSRGAAHTSAPLSRLMAHARASNNSNPTFSSQALPQLGSQAGPQSAPLPPAPELQAVYWLTSPTLAPRLALVPPLRVPAEATPLCEVYRAPLGRLSYTVVQVPAVPALMAWNKGVTEEALRLFGAAAAAALQRTRGRGGCYMVPSGPERWVVSAAFSTAAGAVWWALNLRYELLSAPWPQELLSHELCEVVEAATVAPEPCAAAHHSEAQARPVRRVRRRSLTGCLLPQDADVDQTHPPSRQQRRPEWSPISASPLLAQPPLRSATETGMAAGPEVAGGGGGHGGVQAREHSSGHVAVQLMLRQAARHRRLSGRSGLASDDAWHGDTHAASGARGGQSLPVSPGAGGGESPERPGATAAASSPYGALCGGAFSPHRVSAVRALGYASGVRSGPAEAVVRVTPRSVGVEEAVAAGTQRAGPVAWGGALQAQECSARLPPSSHVPHDVPAAAKGYAATEVDAPAPHGLSATALESVGRASEGMARRAAPASPAALRVAEIVTSQERERVRVISGAHQIRSSGRSAGQHKGPGPFAARTRSSFGQGTGPAAAAPPVGLVDLGDQAGGDPAETPRGSTCGSAPLLIRPVIILRGLRMRAGVSSGTADWFLQCAAHALAYSGRPVNTATKLAAAAASGQVLCDEATRQEAVAEQMWAAGVEDASLPRTESVRASGGVAVEVAATNAAVAVAAAQSRQAQPQLEGANREEAAAAATPPLCLTFTPAADTASSAAKKKLLAHAYICGIREGAEAGAVTAPRDQSFKKALPSEALEPKSRATRQLRVAGGERSQGGTGPREANPGEGPNESMEKDCQARRQDFSSSCDSSTSIRRRRASASDASGAPNSCH